MIVRDTSRLARGYSPFGFKTSNLSSKRAYNGASCDTCINGVLKVDLSLPTAGIITSIVLFRLV